MVKIWKYELELTDRQDVLMPVGAQILSVALQNGVICIWAMVAQFTEKQSRCIEINGTGNLMPQANRVFIGTVVMNPFVWHVFEVKNGC